MYKNLVMKEDKFEIQSQIHQITFEFEETFHINSEDEFYEHSGLLAIISSKLAFHFKLKKKEKVKIVICGGGFSPLLFIKNEIPIELKHSDSRVFESMLDFKPCSNEKTKQKSYRENVRSFMKKGRKY